MEIIIKPLITEKMTGLTEKVGSYGFLVNKKANKIQIKTAVEKAYGVSVATVNTMNYGGKLKSRYTKAGVIEGRTNAVKKALVTLATGDVIDFYSGI